MYHLVNLEERVSKSRVKEEDFILEFRSRGYNVLVEKPYIHDEYLPKSFLLQLPVDTPIVIEEVKEAIAEVAGCFGIKMKYVTSYGFRSSSSKGPLRLVE
jgi:hypothetical protein